MKSTTSARYGLPALALAYFTLGTGSLAVIGLLGPLAVQFGVSQAEIASLVTVFALTFAVAAPLVQVTLGTLPKRTLLNAGLAVLAVGSLASVLAPSFAWAIAARVLMAMGAACVGPVASSLGAGLVQPHEQTKALATVFGGMTMATVVGVPLSAWVGSILSWQAVFYAVAILAALCAITIHWLIEDTVAGQRIPLRAFIGVFQRASTGWAVGVTLFQMAAQFATYALISLLLQERFNATSAVVSLALMIFGVGGIGGNWVAGRIGDRFPTESVLWVSQVGLMVVFLALASVSERHEIALLLLASWAVFAMLFQAPQQKRLIALAPDMRGLLLAMNASALYLGMSLGSLVARQTHSLWGSAALPLASMALLTGAMLALRISSISADREAKRPSA